MVTYFTVNESIFVAYVLWAPITWKLWFGIFVWFIHEISAKETKGESRIENRKWKKKEKKSENRSKLHQT